ncbi:MAG: prolyl oligopeptidase family serine peptidase [Candidatus Zixiibacteriota bacterium]
MRTHRVTWNIVIGSVILSVCTMADPDPLAFDYPETERGSVVDTLHGIPIPDPYRWLEQDVRESEAVAKWVEEQNKVTFSYLKSLPQRPRIRQRLEEVFNYERQTAPFKRGGKYFYSHNDGLQDQSVVYVLDSLGATPRKLFDPNTWSEDGTVALAGFEVSHDGRYVAYGVSEAGSDWNTWRIRDMRTGKDMPDQLNWVKFSTPVWSPDSKGLYYGQYPPPEEGEAYQQSNLDMKLRYHKLGTLQEQDSIVYERPDEPEWGFSVNNPDEGDRFLVMTTWKAGHTNLLSYLDLKAPEQGFKPIISEWGAEYGYLGQSEGHLLILTNHDAPNSRIVMINPLRPEPSHWIEIVPESDEALEWARIVGDRLITHYLHHASSRVRIFDFLGKHVRDVELPGIGSVSGFNGPRHETETFYTFSSFDTPPTIYKYDVTTGESELYWQADVDIDLDQFEVEQVFYTSKDGTRVPMFLTHRKDIKLDGTNPVLLYGYGGFNSSQTPYYSSVRLTWCRMGGVFAVACIRGGGEYGKAWHEAGKKTKRQNVYDDFIAAAEWLIDNKYTNPKRIAINGGSNGGLLVGACMNQRPDLFGVCVPQVGVMDMLRFHKFTAGRFWTDDYGDVNVKEEFEALYAQSPYHNLKPGTEYPATLILTADTDDRVVPAHSIKYAAALQAAQAGDAPVMIRIETRAGHGAGTPISKWIEEYADIYAFILENMDYELPDYF